MSPPQIDDIYLVKHVYKDCKDIRPCIILNVSVEEVSVILISSSKDLCSIKITQDFIIMQSHRDFADTGLIRTSYVAGDQIWNIQQNDLIRKIGKLSGELLKSFHNWID